MSSKIDFKLILKITTILAFVVTCWFDGVMMVNAQADTAFLEGYIETDQTLTSGSVYIIRNNIKVTKNATMTIEQGASLQFAPRTRIVVEGGLVVNGGPGALVNFSNVDDEYRGSGILISGDEGSNVSIKYARFSGLTDPIDFEYAWYRPNVTVEHCEFTDISTGEPAISITSPFNEVFEIKDKRCELSFSYNNFVNNWGSIFIENLQDDVLDLSFNYNLITNNVVFGLAKGVASNTPVFGYFDDEDRQYRFKATGNSVFGNYQIDDATDTVVREISFGIQGEGESFLIPNNFYRSKDPRYVSSTFDHFYQNNQLPLLKPEPVLNAPSPKVHAHIWKVNINNAEVSNYSSIPDVEGSTVTFEVFFNRPVTEFGITQLESVFYDTVYNGIQIKPISLQSPSWSEDNMRFTFSIDDATFLQNSLGYLVIKNFRDTEAFDVPEFTIGQQNAINTYDRLLEQGQVSTFIPPAELIGDAGGSSGFIPDIEDIETIEELSQLGNLDYLGAYTSLAKTWELGLAIGSTNYLGDLTAKFIDKEQFRWSASIFGQYNINTWFSARLSFLYGRISGTDVLDPDVGRRKRLANFRSDIYEGALTLHFHLLQYGISKGERFSPSIYTGIGFFHMDPQARIYTGLDIESGDPQYLAQDDAGNFVSLTEENASREQFVWVPLQPIGTEGQTAGTFDPEFPTRSVPEQYKKWHMVIPLGINLDFLINKKWTIGLEGGFRFTFTDYIDDVSGFYFDRRNDMQAIIDVNTVIEGKVGRTTVILPNTISYINSRGEGQTLPTAAVIANPSLVTTLFNDKENPGTILTSQRDNDAFSFPDARKGDANRDWYAFFGFKASKIFGYNKYNRQQKRLSDSAPR